MTRARGTVRQRASGRWYAVLSVTDAMGKRSRPTIGPFASKREANAALTAALAERDAGSYVVPSAEPLATFLDTWLESRRHDLRPSTMHGYRAVVGRYVTEPMGATPLRDLRPQDIERVYSAMVDAGLSARTVRTLHVVLRRALADAVRWQVLSRNPADAVRPPRLQAVEMHTWDADQLRAFLAYASAHTDAGTYAALHLAAMTGMRRGEVCGLDWESVDLERSRLRVVNSLVSVAGTLREGPPKTAKGRRVVDLDAGTVAVLRRWRIAQPPSLSVVGIHPETLSDRFEAAVRDSGLPRIRFHDLRHTAATLMLAGGIPVHVVAARLGHATPTITLSVYAHVLPTQGVEAAAVMGAVVTESVTERAQPTAE